MARRARQGQAHLPDPLPHPDDIVINLQTGEVEFRGPITKEEELNYEETRPEMLIYRSLDSEFDEKYRRLRNPEKRLNNRRMADLAREIGARIEAALLAAYMARKAKAEAASQE